MTASGVSVCAGCGCRLRRLFAAQTWLSLAGLWSGSACDHRLPPVMSRSAPARAVGSTQRRLELARRLRRRGRLCQRPLVPGQPCHGISCQIFSLALWPLVGPIATGYRRLPLRVLVSVAPTRGPAMWCSPSSAVASPGVAASLVPASNRSAVALPADAASPQKQNHGFASAGESSPRVVNTKPWFCV